MDPHAGELPADAPWQGWTAEEVRSLLRRGHQEHFADHFENRYSEDGVGSEAQKRCGHGRVFGADVELREENDGDGIYALGIRQCGSVWCCPVCARRICRRKGKKVQEAIDSWRDQGGYVYLLNLTTSHHQGQSLEMLRDAVRDAWSYVRSGSVWSRITEYYGIEHYIQTTEVTRGENGWHPHKHVLLFTREPWSEPVPWREPDGGTGEDVRDTGPGTCLGDRIFERWRNRLVRYRGPDRAPIAMRKDPARFDTPLDPPSREHGVRIVGGHRAGGYVSKLGLGNESVRMDLKEARGTNRTPWEILRDWTFFRRDRDARLWREYIEAMHGTAHSHWSEGLADAVATSQEELDLEEEPDDEEDRMIVRVAGECWDRVARQREGKLLPDLRHAYREGGIEQLLEAIRMALPDGWRMRYYEDERLVDDEFGWRHYEEDRRSSSSGAETAVEAA